MGQLYRSDVVVVVVVAIGLSRLRTWALGFYMPVGTGFDQVPVLGWHREEQETSGTDCSETEARDRRMETRRSLDNHRSDDHGNAGEGINL